MPLPPPGPTAHPFKAVYGVMLWPGIRHGGNTYTTEIGQTAVQPPTLAQRAVCRAAPTGETQREGWGARAGRCLSVIEYPPPPQIP